jgi:antitoxin component YwqK of YwqJK toxin-antitoxin module
MKRNLYSIISLFILTATINAQKIDLLPISKEVIVEYEDSLVRANVLLEKENIEVDFSIIYFWHNKGVLSHNMGGYTGELLHGEYLVFDNQMNLITKGKFDKGIKEGIWKRWNANGMLKQIMNYKKGKLDGELLSYNETGKIIDIKEYKNGELVVKEEKQRKSLFNKDEKVVNDSILVNQEPSERVEN